MKEIADMQRMLKSMLAGGVFLGSMIGLTMASPAAKAGSIGSAAVMKAGDGCTTYLCQKKDQNGCWCTCYVCYDYNQMKNWYDAQGSNARVIAQK
jgi:hypothetical protein